MEEDHLRRLGDNQDCHCYGRDELQNDHEEDDTRLNEKVANKKR